MRCFVASWPDSPTRQRLTALSDDVRARIDHRRATRADDLHLTLAFIGNLDDATAYRVADAIASLRFRPFAWQLDALGFFAQAGVVWAGTVKQPGKPLAALADRVRCVLDQFDLCYDRRPLTPHVTILRGVKRFNPEPLATIKWRIDSIALYRSSPAGQASHYTRVLRDITQQMSRPFVS